jgi:hypothetical protein
MKDVKSILEIFMRLRYVVEFSLFVEIMFVFLVCMMFEVHSSQSLDAIISKHMNVFWEFICLSPTRAVGGQWKWKVISWIPVKAALQLS